MVVEVVVEVVEGVAGSRASLDRSFNPLGVVGFTLAGTHGGTRIRGLVDDHDLGEGASGAL